MLIKTALGEVGYLEKASNTYLDDKTKNAGKANYTKYGKWYGINPDAWCAMFVSWCAAQAGAGDIIPRHASCTLGIEAFKRLGRWKPRKSYMPKPGDIIYFGTASGAPQHVGIVWAVTGGRVYTVEGNTSAGEDVVIANGGAVAEKNYALTNARIIGYGHPEWPEEKEDDMTPGEFIASLTNEQAYEVYRKAAGYMASQEIPDGYNARAEYDAAVANGITDGSRPLAPASRLETAIMIERSMNTIFLK